MAFLDNSGDIILDAVLTDTGRARLARGDGSFQIAKFALADDEINYSLYDKNSASGSAYYDLTILQTPILEAFTNNTSTMKSLLLSITRTNLLYLPVIKINSNGFPTDSGRVSAGSVRNSLGSFFVGVDAATKQTFGTRTGFIDGYALDGNPIRVDQGLDTSEISPIFSIDADLKETQYIIEIDNRLGKIFSAANQQASLSFIDDDNVATYYVTSTDFIFDLGTPDPTVLQTYHTIQGPRGTALLFKIQASLELNSSQYLFDTLGSLTTIITSNDARYIDSVVRVRGVTTGYTIDIPIRFIKKV
ncbi:MAG: hypothetical protein RIR47_1060 [Bacteroidota bacterium]|jgi:hypothetical protein